ncbi:MAG: NADPH-dependent 7-cyano-7-deazaguanine reductase QueF [Gammaproteobacteria bacterium]|nr:NADPH-dependent 7-cyano-7-deazaguanine reductase QueF [Gammaproteobacteria bacterium]
MLSGNSMSEILLGQDVSYESVYNPGLLAAVSRQQTRKAINIKQSQPFKGVDIWNAWELSWLNPRGKPQVACAMFSYSSESPHLVESKSLKLYLNSFNQSQFSTNKEVANLIEADLEKTVQSKVNVEIYSPRDNWPGLSKTEGICLDEMDIAIAEYQLTPDLLSGSTDQDAEVLSERLHSHLFKSNCMVTGQPDWATIFIEYKGKPIQHEALLKYLISFRSHQAFHEPCVERVFSDLMQYCKPEELSVYCRYTRRGGLDINPFRSTTDQSPENIREWRQ